jgi:hypothetical protein
MSTKIEHTIYIDETCHLENDSQPVMCIGYTKIESENYDVLKNQIKKIKLEYKSPTEIKWNKLSMSRLPLYKALIDFFFDHDIQFRAVLVKNKSNLNHSVFNKGDHNTFYYKLTYQLLNNQWVNPADTSYKVLIDIKDTWGNIRLRKLKEVFDNKHYGNSPFLHFQNIKSHENEFIQYADLFIGAIAYKAKEEHLKPEASEVKKEIVNYLEEKSGYQIDDGTPPWEEKFNIHDFQLKSF